MGEGHCKVSLLFFRISDAEIALNYRNPKNYSRKIHGQFTGIHVHKRERIGESLQSFRPIPKANKKNAAIRTPLDKLPFRALKMDIFFHFVHFCNENIFHFVH